MGIKHFYSLESSELTLEHPGILGLKHLDLAAAKCSFCGGYTLHSVQVAVISYH